MTARASLVRRTLSSTPTVLAALCVLAFYGYIAGGASFDFPRLWVYDQTHYSSLAEGFRRGHTYLPRKPETELMALSNPYDPKAREGLFYLWDASYYNGRYYLYFSPLPVLLVHLPYRFLRGSYPPDSLVAAIFAAWSFLAAVAFARTALRAIDAPGRFFPIWVLLIGLGNVIPFVLNDIRMYQIAILTGTAMSATFAYALLRFVESPSIGKSVLVGSSLGLAIAARPNLIVLVAVAVAIVFWRSKGIREIVRNAAGLFIPLAVVAAAMISYNVARFDEPFEFGLSYQLTLFEMRGRRICSVCTLPALSSFANDALQYIFTPPLIRSAFPFVDLINPRLEGWTGPTEQIVGIVPLVPLTMVGTALALVYLFDLRRRRPDVSSGTTIAILVGAWAILLFNSSCWWMTARYSLDFMLLMTAGSAVMIERTMASARAAGASTLPYRISVALLAIYSIMIGVLLGFIGPGDAFRRSNPQLYDRIVDWLT